MRVDICRNNMFDYLSVVFFSKFVIEDGGVVGLFFV